MKRNFLQVSIGISLMLIAAGFFMRSIQPANAEMPSPDKFIDQTVSKIGKYQMAIIAVPEASTRIIVWNTETGKSTYYRNDGMGWEKHSSQLPANPIGE